MEVYIITVVAPPTDVHVRDQVTTMTTATATTIARGFVIRTNFVGPTNTVGAESLLATRDNETTYRVMLTGITPLIQSRTTCAQRKPC